MDWSSITAIVLGSIGGLLTLTSPQVRAFWVSLLSFAKPKEPGAKFVTLEPVIGVTTGDYRQRLAANLFEIADAIGAENVPVTMLEKLLALEPPKAVQLPSP